MLVPNMLVGANHSFLVPNMLVPSTNYKALPCCTSIRLDRHQGWPSIYSGKLGSGKTLLNTFGGSVSPVESRKDG